jgi:hypothetical protein
VTALEEQERSRRAAGPDAPLRDEQRRDSPSNQSRRHVLTGIIGARRAWTASMISALSIPWS